MQFPIVIYQDEDGVFIGEIPTLKGVHSYGHDLKELRKNLTEAIELYFGSKFINKIFKKAISCQLLTIS